VLLSKGGGNFEGTEGVGQGKFTGAKGPADEIKYSDDIGEAGGAGIRSTLEGAGGRVKGGKRPQRGEKFAEDDHPMGRNWRGKNRKNGSEQVLSSNEGRTVRKQDDIWGKKKGGGGWTERKTKKKEIWITYTGI